MDFHKMNLKSLIRRDQARILRNQDLNSGLVTAFWDAVVHTFLHTQTVAQTTWTVWHGMGERPMMAVILLNGEVIAAKVEHLSANEVRVTHSTAQSGYLICLRPGMAFDQTEPQSTWQIPHTFDKPPIVQVVVDGEIVFADIVHTTASSVEVTFSSAKEGYALLVPPISEFPVTVASAIWPIAHNLGSFPILQIVNNSGEVLQGDLVHNSVNAATITTAAPSTGKALAISAGSETLNAFDPNLESSYPATTLQSGTFPALIHFVQPSKSGFRAFAEIEVGDVILDFKADYQLPATAMFDVAGNRYVQKDAGSVLSQYWDIVIERVPMWRTLILTLQK